MNNQFEQQCNMFYKALDDMPISFLNELAENLPEYVKARKLKWADELLESKQKQMRRSHLRVVK